MVLVAGDRGLREGEKRLGLRNSTRKTEKRRIRGSHSRKILPHIEVLREPGRSDDDPLEKGRKVHLALSCSTARQSLTSTELDGNGG